MSLRVLVAVDGSRHALRALEHVLRLRDAGCALELHLLNVQMPLDTGHVRIFIARESLDEHYRDEGLAALREAEALLEQAGQAFTSHVAAGNAGATIVHYASGTGCELVVMGSHGRTGLRNVVMGSVARDVLRLSTVPVTVVRSIPPAAAG